MKRVQDIMLGCMCLMLSATPIYAMNEVAVIVEHQGDFKDVKPSDGYYAAINYVSEQGLMRGLSDTEFGMNQAMTRGTLILALYHLADNPEVNHQSSFQDVSKESKYAKAAQWGVDNKIVSGYSKALFKPEQPVTREEMITMLYNYTQFIGRETPIEGMSIREYVDEQGVSKWARNPMRWGLGVGNIVWPTEEQKLMPQASVTRGEAAAVLTRYCAHTLNWSGSCAEIDRENKEYNLIVNFPKYIAPYMELDQMQQNMGTNGTYDVVLLKFTKGTQSANIGTLYIYTTAQYEAVKAEGGPLPTELFKKEDLVVAFTGLQDMPFELQTPEATMIAQYHQDIENILKTIKLVPLV